MGSSLGAWTLGSPAASRSGLCLLLTFQLGCPEHILCICMLPRTALQSHIMHACDLGRNFDSSCTAVQAPLLKQARHCRMLLGIVTLLPPCTYCKDGNCYTFLAYRTSLTAVLFWQGAYARWGWGCTGRPPEGSTHAKHPLYRFCCSFLLTAGCPAGWPALPVS